ncbi:hydroxymethylglutaryl-CoA lyase [Bacillus sp. CMF21]|uniref:hydroxymethylglutaryl-CoA lyase n=1 Tax=Metabacillus dongyingensis TaxID=2874282 RepID=UPI001CBA6D02|nr:hydroxymethylglutaryl-CoA lyase [Metabacillus dongyingensis]UAL50918.1 hydroxymethylglutaryl-CoA lyase [Metabacillus dongyingensis]USK27194.1 hydroxymethylglutaryl-CoA lyase [Bacillus sp. CMF21]
MNLPEQVTLIEVGPRDGLQNEKNEIPTDIKVQFIKELKKAGFKEMELTSFVSPKWVPQLKDAGDIIKYCTDESRNLVLTPNKKGVARAIEAKCLNIAFFVGVSESFNLKNINSTTKESMEKLLPQIRELKAEGYFIRACVSTAFYCPYEGKIHPDAVLNICQQFADAGVDDLSVADTIGMANPLEVYELFSRLKAQFPDTLLTAHFHDTRGMALANIYAALQAGVDRFDTSAGGLGGCPFAPGATGNAATEDVLHMLETMNIETGIEMNQLLKAVEVIEPHLAGAIQSKQYQLSKRENAVK